MTLKCHTRSAILVMNCKLCKFGRTPVNCRDSAVAVGRSYAAWATLPLTAQRPLKRFHLDEANDSEVNAYVIHSDLLKRNA